MRRNKLSLGLAVVFWLAGCTSTGPLPVTRDPKAVVADPRCAPFVLPVPQGIQPPQLLERVNPEGPLSGPSRGYACVQDTINAEGKVVEVEVLASNNDDFAAAARRALTRWRYEPGTRDGIPVNVRGSHSFSYQRSR